MSRINTNVTSLIAQRVLKTNNDNLNNSLERLSTGLRINSGADDPAGLIASENLRAEKTGISTAIDNGTRAGNIVGTAEGGLNEVSSLLNQLGGLVGSSANAGGLSQEEKDANQLQVDSILSTVNRISDSTAFEGKQLLNGNLDYTTSSTSNLNNLQINSARIPDGGNVGVVVAVTQSAQTGTVAFATNGNPGLSATNNVVLQVAGNLGSQQISLAGGTTKANIAAAINSLTNNTGVTATVSATGIRLNAQNFGASSFVSLQVVSETTGKVAANAVGSLNTKNFGRDAAVTVNGATAQADGTHVTYRDASVDVSFDIASGANTNSGAGSTTITGGGATFNLGSKVSLSSKASIGIGSVATTSLGDTNVGFLSSLASGGTNDIASGNGSQAQLIVNQAIKQVSQLRGRLGAFQKYTVGSTVNALSVALENATSAESAIRDTDFSSETANLTRSQILSQAATTVLSQANSAPQQVLKLLG